jgi:6-pyruvoyltetrahydropterin/6-carboxytetrahydropterin synthase
MKNNIRVTKEFTFEMAHALYGYDGACKNVHGHSYHLSVTVSGKPIDDINNVKNGMVIDFGDIKKIVKEHVVDKYDHAFMVNAKTPHAKLNPADYGYGDNFFKMDFQPTCENMIIEFAKVLQIHLPKQVKLHSLKLRETATSFVAWHATDN